MRGDSERNFQGETIGRISTVLKCDLVGRSGGEQ